MSPRASRCRQLRRSRATAQATIGAAAQLTRPCTHVARLASSAATASGHVDDDGDVAPGRRCVSNRCDSRTFAGSYDGARVTVVTKGCSAGARLNGASPAWTWLRLLKETRDTSSMSGKMAGDRSRCRRTAARRRDVAAAGGNGRVTIAGRRNPGLEMVRTMVLAFGKPSGGPPARSGSAFNRQRQRRSRSPADAAFGRTVIVRVT